MKNIFSKNGQILPLEDAVIHIDSIEAQYGYGVYETVKLRNNILYFIPEHINRLFNSARLLELSHGFTKKQIQSYIDDYCHALGEESANIKLLLYGGESKESSTLFIIASAPYYPKRVWYREGVTLKSTKYSRWMPHAKSLNMTASYYIYSKAKKEGYYDALLIDSNKNVLEGTRTNIYVIKGSKIYSPPKENILTGVTMMSLEKVVKKSKFKIEYKTIPLDSIKIYDGMFLTSTSSKILPVKKIDKIEYSSIFEGIYELISLYDKALGASIGDFSKL